MNTQPLLICINGDLGSGKSAVGRWLAHHFEAEYFSTGALQREIAARRGLSTLELNQLAESDPSIDEALDDACRKIEKTHERLVIDSRLAWYRSPTSTKIRLVCHPSTSAQRILAAEGRVSENYGSLESAVEQLAARRTVEARRYHSRYGVQIGEPANYDFFVVTDGLTVEEIGWSIAVNIGHPPATPLIVASPYRVFPTIPPWDAAVGEDERSSARLDSEPSVRLLDLVLSGDDLFVVGTHRELLQQCHSAARIVFGRIVEGHSSVEPRPPQANSDLLRQWEKATGGKYQFAPQADQ